MPYKGLVVWVLSALTMGCSSTESATPISPSDAGATDADTPIPTAPTHPPTSLSFRDQDPAWGAVGGTVTIGKATSEEDVRAYRLYWGSSASAKLAKITDVPATGKDVTYALAAPVPAGATQLLSYAVNDSGEMATGVASRLADVAYADISAGQGSGSGKDPASAIDVANGKLLVVTRNEANGSTPSLFRCNLDGTGCTHSDISAGQGAGSGTSPSMAIDVANGKLLVATRNENNGRKLGLFRCNLDGTSCTHTDISAGQDEITTPHIVVDAASSKLLVVASNSANLGRPGLFRCNLDGTSCTHTDVSVGQGAKSGSTPKCLIDKANGKLLIVTRNDASFFKSTLFRCNLDGTGCTFTDISAGQASNSGFAPSTAIDTANAKLLVVTQGQSKGKNANLVRCNVDGTGCTHTELATGPGIDIGLGPFMVVDAANAKLLVAGPNWTDANKPTVLRCNLDGTGCTFTDVSAGQSDATATWAVVDAVNGKLLVVVRNGSNSSKPGLFSIGLW